MAVTVAGDPDSPLLFSKTRVVPQRGSRDPVTSQRDLEGRTEGRKFKLRKQEPLLGCSGNCRTSAAFSLAEMIYRLVAKAE